MKIYPRHTDSKVGVARWLQGDVTWSKKSACAGKLIVIEATA